MNTSFLKILFTILKSDNHPAIPNMREDIEGKIFFEGLIRALLVIGKPGVGKSMFIAALIVAYILAFPDRGALVLDASGQLINDIVAIVLRLPPALREKVKKTAGH
jgi:hypothetical protein